MRVSSGVHAPVPEHPPPVQPINTEPDAGVAVNTGFSPVDTETEHVVPQLIDCADPVLVIVPTPNPFLKVVRVYVSCTTADVVKV
jgi:hypothetical protein